VAPGAPGGRPEHPTTGAHRCGVDPTGSGVGTALLDWAKELRPEGLRLTTFESNVGARRFYDRHGFRVVGGTDGDNEEGAPDLHLAWP
jgi:GNAT superfamily N-acetyltransferase